MSEEPKANSVDPSISHPATRSAAQSAERAVENATRAARSTEQTQWVAQVVESELPALLDCYAACESQDRFFWQRPAATDRFVAWGRVDEIESAGSERFADVEAWVAGVGSRLYWGGLPRPMTAPLFVGGFGFEDDAQAASEWKAFPAARFVLPGTIGESLDGRTRWTLLARVEPGTKSAAVEAALANRLLEVESLSLSKEEDSTRSSDVVAPSPFDLQSIGDWPPGPEYRVRSDRAHSVFTRQVSGALDAIEDGRLAKVVLARSLSVDHDGALDLRGFLARLGSLYPSCALVAMARGDDTFLAATPETLIRLKGDRLETAALAGSAPRGRSPEEDEELAAELASSAKEKAEHAYVVEALCEVLAPLCDEFERPDRPGLRKLFGIQHLETSISGRLRREADSANNGMTILGLVSALHPTPAVGGVPRQASRDWLRRHEGLDRGWYASPMGWLDGEGGGDFCVALRSALIHVDRGDAGREAASRAWLFAGAGIVAGSQPEQELAETRIKLRALLAPLTEI